MVRKQTGVRLFIALVSVVTMLAVCEGFFRAKGWYPPPNGQIRTARPDLYKADPNVGYTLWPSTSKTYRYPPNSTEAIPLVSNSDGFRTAREFTERDGRTRILVVGDSFVFGQGVRAEDRITEQLEAIEPRWHVDNMGMTGWGLDLMIRAIEHHGPKADPDVVVLAIYTDDFRRLLPSYAGLGFAYPKFELVGKELRSVPFRSQRFWERLRLVQLMYQSKQGNRNRYELNEALLNRYLDDARSIGFRPVVAFLPGQTDTPEDQERRSFLSRWATAHYVPYADLTGAIFGGGVDKLFIPDNSHWNSTGHRIAAEALRDLINRVLSSAR